jgi:phosphohistidine swiveling domain-containing protein
MTIKHFAPALVIATPLGLPAAVGVAVASQQAAPTSAVTVAAAAAPAPTAFAGDTNWG